MTYTVFRSNVAERNGGGLYNTDANVRLTNATLEGNEAFNNGGGVYTRDAQSAVLTNVLFIGNRAESGGGYWDTAPSVLGFGRTETTIGTSTFSANCATSSGGAILAQVQGFDIRNSILWGNEGTGCGGSVVNDVTNLVGNLSNSIVEGGLSGAIGDNPQYIDPPTLASNGPTTDGNVQIQPTSPAVNAADGSARPQDVADVDEDGNTSEVLPLDRAGSSRVRDGQMDIGALEGSSLDLVVTGTPGTNGSDAGWRDMGVPVTGSSGAITVADVERGTGTGLENLSKWGVWRDVNDSWKRLDKDSPLPAGRGFTVYLFDKRESTIDPSITFETTQGSIIGDQDVTVGDGSPTGDGELAQDAQFHFLANPYAVPYNLNVLNSVPNFSDFQALVQIWDVEDGYQTINMNPSAKTGISSWQAFYVERFNVGSGATQLTFPSSGRLPAASNTNSFFGE
ncbi:hypothetical protein BSZ35_17725, partial [Salinibacter sp. 10B]